MAKKKAAEKEDDAFYNWEISLAKMEIPRMLKAGIRYYIVREKLTPKNDKDLDKIIKDYQKLTIGE